MSGNSFLCASVCIVSLRNGVYYVPEKALPVYGRGFMACRKRLSCMAVEAMSVPRNVYSVDYQCISENAENSRICRRNGSRLKILQYFEDMGA